MFVGKVLEIGGLYELWKIDISKLIMCKLKFVDVFLVCLNEMNFGKGIYD